jgi:hypothetical protein
VQHRQAVEAAQLQFKQEEANRIETARWEALHAATAAYGRDGPTEEEAREKDREQHEMLNAGMVTAACEPPPAPTDRQAAPEGGARRDRSRSRSPVQTDRSSAPAAGGESIAVPE